MIKWQTGPWIYQVLPLRSVRLAREANFASMERTERRVFFVAEDPFFALAFENRSKWLFAGFRPGCSNNAFEIDFVGLRAHIRSGPSLPTNHQSRASIPRGKLHTGRGLPGQFLVFCTRYSPLTRSSTFGPMAQCRFAKCNKQEPSDCGI